MSPCHGDQELFLSHVSILTHPFPRTGPPAPVSLGCGLVPPHREFGGGGPLRFASSISIFISFKSRARRLPGGAGNISGCRMALPPAPVLRAGFPAKHTLFIPGGALTAPFCTASPFHIALAVGTCCCIPLAGVFGE